MTLTERLDQDYIIAYKAKDSMRLNVLRMIKTALKNFQVEHMRPAGEDEVLDLVMKQSKQRQDSFEQFTSAGRHDLATIEAAEMAILLDYMPKPLGGEELAAAIQESIAEAGATSMRDMGKVMQVLTAQYKGRFDGKAASDAVKKALQHL